MSIEWRQVADRGLSVEVDYYSQEHRTLLARYPTAARVQALVDGGMLVSREEFLTYFLYHRVRAAPNIYRNFKTVKGKIRQAEQMLADLVELDGSIYLSKTTEWLPTELIEHIGESVTLTTMNRVHGLTEADWGSIAKSRNGKKYMDWERGSDGTIMIRAEAKGCIVDDIDRKSSAMSQKQRDIRGKKEATRSIYPIDLAYGVIAAIPRGHGRLKALILDPPGEGDDGSPRDQRIIARLEFLRWLVWVVSPRSLFATALAMRVADVKALRAPYELSGVPIAQVDGRPFGIYYSWRAEQYLSLFSNRSRVEDGPAGGVVFLTGDRRGLIFLGFREELVEMAAEQDFDRIANYEAETTSRFKTVTCTVSASEFKSFQVDPSELPAFYDRKSHVQFELSGMLRYSREGLVFGVLPLPARRARRSADERV